MRWKEAVTRLSQNILPKNQPEIRNIAEEGNEVKANLPLQMAAYFNAVFAPVWATVLLLYLTDNYNMLGKLTQVIIVTIITIIFIVELLRVYMIYEGNLKDKIPELAGFWMLSVFVQLPLQGLLLFNPYFGFSVLEIGSQSIMFVLLLLEIVFGYAALRYTASEQAKYYKNRKLLVAEGTE